MATPTKNPCGTIGGISFEEEYGSGPLTTSRGSARGTRTFFVDWNDRVEFGRQLTGFFTIVGDNVNQQFPVSFPGYEFIEAAGIKTTGMGKMSFESNGDFRYEFAKVEVTYEPRPKQDGSTAEKRAARTLATHTTKVNVEFIEFGTLSLAWVANPKVAIKNPFKKGRRIVTVLHTLTETEAPLSKKVLSASRAGDVNNKTFLAVSAGKMLYLGSEESTSITSDGLQPFRMIHNFVERPEASWNEFFRDDIKVPAFQQVQTVETETEAGKLFELEESNFDELIE